MKKNLSKLKRAKLITCLLLILSSLSAQQTEQQHIRLYFGGAGNSALSSMPMVVGTDYLWPLNQSFSVTAGASYYSAFGSKENWQINAQNYEWNNFEDFFITLNSSVRYNLVLLELKNQKGALNFFVEPGAVITPFPALYIDDRKEDQSHLNAEPLNGSADLCFLFWQVQGGLAYQVYERDNGVSVRYELSTTLSNIDYYKQYRELKIANTALNPYLPKAKNNIGFRLALCLGF